VFIIALAFAVGHQPSAISHRLYSGKFELTADGRRLIAPGIRIDSSEFRA
jgi:hypothetical protein